jgi:hypothetical protein
VCVVVWVCWVWGWRRGQGSVGFAMGGVGMWSGVLRECSFSKWVCRMSITWGGCVVMLFVVGSLMASSLGWPLALVCKPAAVLRLLW